MFVFSFRLKISCDSVVFWILLDGIYLAHMIISIVSSFIVTKISQIMMWIVAWWIRTHINSKSHVQLWTSKNKKNKTRGTMVNVSAKLWREIARVWGPWSYRKEKITILYCFINILAFVTMCDCSQYFFFVFVIFNIATTSKWLLSKNNYVDTFCFSFIPWWPYRGATRK